MLATTRRVDQSEKHNTSKCCNFKFNKHWKNPLEDLPLIDKISLICNPLFLIIGDSLPQTEPKVAFEVRDFFIIMVIFTSIFNIQRIINRACHLKKAIKILHLKIGRVCYRQLPVQIQENRFINNPFKAVEEP
jgi:hypothetical protein